MIKIIKFIVKCIIYLLMSPWIILLATIETLVWAFDSENKPWGENVFFNRE